MNRSPEDQNNSDAGGEGQGFLQRWSKRKKLDAEPDRVVVDQHNLHAVADASADELQDALGGQPLETVEVEQVPVLTDADMPPLESLQADSDYTPFMSEGVSTRLRNMALKKLFLSGMFNARDGLDDYDEDYTTFEPLGDTVTSDMKFHQRRKEKERLAEEAEQRRLQEEADALASEDEETLEESVDETEQDSQSADDSTAEDSPVGSHDVGHESNRAGGSGPRDAKKQSSSERADNS